MGRLRRRPLWDSLGQRPDGRPLIVAFSTASCGVCRSAQKPALRRLAAEMTGIQVLEVDAGERPELARAFGVVTVPTTVVFAASGEVVAANHGYTPSDRLREQILGPRPA